MDCESLIVGRVGHSDNRLSNCIVSGLEKVFEAILDSQVRPVEKTGPAAKPGEANRHYLESGSQSNI